MYKVRLSSTVASKTSVLSTYSIFSPTALQQSKRYYTPIYEEPSVHGRVTALRQQDESSTLWYEAAPVPSVSKGLNTWIRMGNDPVLHTALPTPPATAAAQLPSASNSPFQYVEDYIGTNLVTGDAAQVSESIALWTNYFQIKYSNALRQSRRTAANYIGPVNAPMNFTDEADHPSTKWSKDTYFGEKSYLVERHVKEKVGNLLDLEEVIYTKAQPESYLSLFNAMLPQTQTRIPLPCPSVWFYEGEAKKAWVDAYVPVAHAAHKFMREQVGAALQKSGDKDGGKALLEKVAAAFAEVHKIQLQRAERQIKAGVRPDWQKASKEEKLAWATVEVELERRSMLDGVFDPENEKDSSEEWKKENEQINAALQKQVADSFSLADFWMHTFRREALETQHVLDEDRLRKLGAAARVRLYDDVALPTLCQDLAAVISKGQIDVRAGVFRPHFNSTFSKIHYVKFGASSIVQHTRTASRELLFHYLATPREVAATAKLYFATKPMSSAIDYTSPYTHRKSIVALCSEYGLELTYARQFGVISSASNIAKAEELIAATQRSVAKRFGAPRRARQKTARAGYQRLLQPISNVYVSQIPSELLDTGADVSSITATTSQKAAAIKEPLVSWPLGSRQAVHYHWPSPYLDRLRRIMQAGPFTADRAAELEALQQFCRLEISLWRKVNPSETQAKKAEEDKQQKYLQTQMKAVPELAEVERYAQKLYSRFEGGVTDIAAQVVENEEWVFAVMLNDQVKISLEEVAEVYLPFKDANGVPLPPGEYKVRVRAYDRESTFAAGTSAQVALEGDPCVCSEAFSSPIKVVDVVPKVVEKLFTKAAAPDTRMKGDDLIPLCAALREAGIDVPWQLEFEVGQALDAKGTFSLSYLLQALQGNQFLRSLAEQGITDVQREVEARVRAHWELTHPGADAAEWAEARRAVLNTAMDKERDWWLADPILEVKDVVTASANHQSLQPMNYPSTVRYAHELCGVLEAEGVSSYTPSGYVYPAAQPAKVKGPGGDGNGTLDLVARATVDGSGAVNTLSFEGASASSSDLDLTSALDLAMSAINQAKGRHATLSTFKTGPLEKQAQANIFCSADQLEFGGKYARTYAYAFEKGKQEINEYMLEGRAAQGTEDLEKLRESDKVEVDRFASSTHPEQRKTRFTPRVTLSGQNIEDPTPDQTTTWGRE